MKTYLGNYKSYTNAFPFETVNGVYTHQRKTTPDKRVFILTRSAFAGQQRDGSMVWSGDITASWQTLKRQIPALLNYSLSGMPFWNADIGGFYSATNYPKGNKDQLYRELYIRWIQFAIFTGMMRSHGTNTPREIYHFGKLGDIAFDIIRKYIDWRYQLEPYIYSTTWQVTSQNALLMRALVMDYPRDKSVYNLGITPYQLSLLNENMDRVVEPCTFKIMVGGSSPSYIAGDKIKNSVGYRSSDQGVNTTIDYKKAFAADFVLSKGDYEKDSITGKKLLYINVKNLGNITDAGKVTMCIDGKEMDEHHFEMKPGTEKKVDFAFDYPDAKTVTFITKHKDLVVNL